MDQFVQEELGKITEPVGRLKDITDFIDSELPATISLEVVQIVARWAFAEAYTQLATDLKEMDMGAMLEIQEACDRLSPRFISQIRELIEVTDDGPPCQG